MSNVIALIPARSGSKGVTHKNIRDLGGYPLIQWSIEACKKSNSINRTIISTDSEEYAKIAKDMGAEVPFLRPAEISTDSSTDYDFVKHALDWFAEHGGEPEYIVHIRPTTPFREPELLSDSIHLLTNSYSNLAFLSPDFCSFSSFTLRFSRVFKSLRANSVVIVSISDKGSTRPLT